MFFRLLLQSFRRQRRSKLLVGAAVMLGAAVATAMMSVATSVGDRINRELRSAGANLVLVPAQDSLRVQEGGVQLAPATGNAYLKEADLPRLKGIFWGHNILNFAPFLPATVTMQSGNTSAGVPLLGTYFSKPFAFGGQNFITGVKQLDPWWQVEGAWPDDASTSQVLAGGELAREYGLRPGSQLLLDGTPMQVTGIVCTGGEEERELLAPLALAQQILHAPGAVASVQLSALTKPEDAFARRNPDTMTPADRDRWYCSPYATSIAFQLQEAIPGAHAEQIRQVEQSEGKVLQPIQGILLLIGIAAVLAAIISVAAAGAASLLQRRQEIGLMKALGASQSSVAALFLAEGTLIALVAGLLGFWLGDGLAHEIGAAIFKASMAAPAVLLPFVLLLSLFVVLGGSLVALRAAARIKPSMALRELA